MDIRVVQTSDLAAVGDIDGAIRSSRYLHLTRTTGEAFGWQFQDRELREPAAESNRLNDDLEFALKNIASGVEEGFARWIEIGGTAVGLVLAQAREELNTLHLLDLRIDFDYRRQGMGSALLFSAMAEARDRKMRAVTAETRTNNHPAAIFLRKFGFEPCGIDTHRNSNHDWVKERTTLMWVCPLD